jgi:hypothetical protein
LSRIARKSDAERHLTTGIITHSSLERTIDDAAEHAPHDVVLMGEEALTPVGKAKFAGEKNRHRTTELCTDPTSEWKLDLRQAAIDRTE